MKVLHLIPSVSPLRGGPSAAVLGMCRELRERGVEVEIATTDDDGPGHLEVETGALIEHEGVPVRFFPRSDFRWSRLTEFQRSPDLMEWLRSSITDYDLLHFHAIFSYVPTAGMRLARRAGIPYIARPLGQLCHWSMRQRSLLKRVYLKSVEAENIRAAAALHFTAEMERSEAAHYVTWRRDFILPHGVEEFSPDEQAGKELRKKLGIPESVPVGLFLGRIHRKKRVDFLIQVWRELPDHVHLLVAGAVDSCEKSALENLMPGHPNGAHIHWLGHVDREHKAGCFAAADVFLLPSESENFGIAVAEALIAGLPVVLSPNQPLAEPVKAHALGRVCPLDTRIWKEAVLALLADREALRCQGEAARAYAQQHYSWPVQGRRLAEIYRDVLS